MKFIDRPVSRKFTASAVGGLLLTYFGAHSTCLDLWLIDRRFLLFFTVGTFLLTHHLALAAALHGPALILIASFTELRDFAPLSEL